MGLAGSKLGLDLGRRPRRLFSIPWGLLSEADGGFGAAITNELSLTPASTRNEGLQLVVPQNAFAFAALCLLFLDGVGAPKAKGKVSGCPNRVQLGREGLRRLFVCFPTQLVDTDLPSIRVER